MKSIALVLLAVALLLGAGCRMAGPGVASATPQDPSGLPRQTTYNNAWVRQPAPPTDVNTPNLEVVDISKRELGRSYIDPDVRAGHYQSAAEKRQAERQAARQAAWKARGGITNIKDEQAGK